MNQSVFMVSMLCCLLVVPIQKFSILIARRKGEREGVCEKSNRGSSAIVRHFRRTAEAYRNHLTFSLTAPEICSAN